MLFLPCVILIRLAPGSIKAFGLQEADVSGGVLFKEMFLKSLERFALFDFLNLRISNERHAIKIRELSRLLCHFVWFRNLVSASQDGKLIVWDGYTTNKVWKKKLHTNCLSLFHRNIDIEK